jgi:hypothetical protein
MGHLAGDPSNEPFGQPSNLYPIKVADSAALAADDPIFAPQQKRGGAGERP